MFATEIGILLNVGPILARSAAGSESSFGILAAPGRENECAGRPEALP